MKKFGYVALIAASVSLLACGEAESNAGESGNTSDSSVATDAGTDITKFFGSENPFCSYANNLDIITPKNAAKSPINTKQTFWNSSLAKFDGTLHGLKVVGVANYRTEGIGVSAAIIFNETNERVLEVLGPIYGGTSHYSEYFPSSKAAGIAVACPTCEYDEHPEYASILDAENSQKVYGLGMSVIECGFYD